MTHFWKREKRQTDPKSATIVIIRSAGESWAEEVHSIPYSIIKEHSDWLTNEKSDQWETSIIAFEFKKQKYLLLDENRIHLVTGLENVTTEQMLRVVRNLIFSAKNYGFFIQILKIGSGFPVKLPVPTYAIFTPTLFKNLKWTQWYFSSWQKYNLWSQWNYCSSATNISNPHFRNIKPILCFSSFFW